MRSSSRSPSPDEITRYHSDHPPPSQPVRSLMAMETSGFSEHTFGGGGVAESEDMMLQRRALEESFLTSNPAAIMAMDSSSGLAADSSSGCLDYSSHLSPRGPRFSEGGIPAGAAFKPAVMTAVEIQERMCEEQEEEALRMQQQQQQQAQQQRAQQEHEQQMRRQHQQQQQEAEYQRQQEMQQQQQSPSPSRQQQQPHSRSYDLPNFDDQQQQRHDVARNLLDASPSPRNSHHMMADLARHALGGAASSPSGSRTNDQHHHPHHRDESFGDAATSLSPIRDQQQHQQQQQHHQHYSPSGGSSAATQSQSASPQHPQPQQRALGERDPNSLHPPHQQHHQQHSPSSSQHLLSSTTSVATLMSHHKDRFWAQDILASSNVGMAEGSKLSFEDYMDRHFDPSRMKKDDAAFFLALADKLNFYGKVSDKKREYKEQQHQQQRQQQSGGRGRGNNNQQQQFEDAHFSSVHEIRKTLHDARVRLDDSFRGLDNHTRKLDESRRQTDVHLSQFPPPAPREYAAARTAVERVFERCRKQQRAHEEQRIRELEESLASKKAMRDAMMKQRHRGGDVDIRSSSASDSGDFEDDWSPRRRGITSSYSREPSAARSSSMFPTGGGSSNASPSPRRKKKLEVLREQRRRNKMRHEDEEEEAKKMAALSRMIQLAADLKHEQRTLYRKFTTPSFQEAFTQK